MNLFFKTTQRCATFAGVAGVALASVVLLCGAGSVPIENFSPQGVMQNDLNAGGHNLTNAATITAGSVVVTGTLTAANLGSAATNAASAFAPASGSANYAPASGSSSYDFAGAATAAVASAVQKTNNLSDVASASASAQNLGVPALIGPMLHNFFQWGDSITEGPMGQPTYAFESYSAVMQAGPLGAGGALMYDLGFRQETTQYIASHYAGTGAVTTTLATTAGSATATLGSALGVSNGMAIGSANTLPCTTLTVSGTTATLSSKATATGTVTCSIASAPTNVYYGELYPGGAANGWTNFYGTPHMLSYAVSGIPCDAFILSGQNDFFENAGAATTLTATTTSGSPNVTITSASSTYASLVYGLVLTGTPLSTSPYPTIVSGQGTANLVLSGNAATTGSFTLTVHYPTTALATWTSYMQGMVTNCHNDGDTPANNGGVTIGLITPSGSTNRMGVSDAFRSEFNAVIAGGTLGQDYTFNGNQYLPVDANISAGNPYYFTDLLHFTARGTSLYGQQLSSFYFRIRPSLAQGPWAAPGVGSLLPASATIYVSPNYGTDTRSGLYKYGTTPFQTVTAAMAAAVAGDNIYVLDGAVVENSGVTLKNGVNITFSGGVTSISVGGTSSIGLTDGGSPVTCTIAGAGQTILANAAFTSLLSISGTASNITFSNLNLNCSANQGFDITFGGATETVTVGGNVTESSGSAIGAGQDCAQWVNPAYGCTLNVSGSLTAVNGRDLYFNSNTGGGANVASISGSATGYRFVEQNGSNSPVLTVGGLSYGTSCTALSDSGTVTLTTGQFKEGASASSALGTFDHSAPITDQTTVSGSTAGTARFSEIWRRANNKEVLGQCYGLNGTATYTFPIAFTSTPTVVVTGTGVTVSAISTTAITVSTSSANSGGFWVKGL